MASILGWTSDIYGNVVVLPAQIWEDKVLLNHPEMASYRGCVLAAVSNPDHVEPDPVRRDRVRFYARDRGPSRWILVVVSYEQEPARVISAFGNRKDPRSWNR